MPFITGDREAPFQLRMARVLLFVEAFVFLLYLALLLLLNALQGNPSIGQATATTSTVQVSALWIPLAIVAIVVFSVAGWGAGAAIAWARWLAIALQVAVIVAEVVQVATTGSSQIITALMVLAFSVGIIVCLTVNNIGAVFREGMAAQPAPTVWVPPALDEPSRAKSSAAAVGSETVASPAVPEIKAETPDGPATTPTPSAGTGDPPAVVEGAPDGDSEPDPDPEAQDSPWHSGATPHGGEPG